MSIKGEVLSFGLVRPMARCRDTAFHAFDGWSVMFRYPCSCGVDHASQASNVWPKGDSNIDVIEVVCPVTRASNEIELTKP